MTLLEWPGVGFLIFVTELEARVFLLSSLDPSGRPRISTGERVSSAHDAADPCWHARRPLGARRRSGVLRRGGKSLTALAGDGARDWAIVDGRALWEGADSVWRRRATIEGHAATCLATTPDGLLIGTAQAHLVRLTDGEPVSVEPFEMIDGRAAWRFITEGMHAHYLRAVAADNETVLVSASTGPGGRRAALYRARLDGEAAFERCADGLPTWFGDNVDTGCLAASGSLVACGTEDGRVFRSLDGGQAWALVAKGLPPVTCLTLR